MANPSELAAEQAHVDRAYARLADRRGVIEELAEPAVNESPGARHERDERQALRARWVRELRLGDSPLCFGRIDTADGTAWHIGRIGVDDEAGDRIVVDWRAPVAEPFYRATPGEPLNLIRRRHLHCRAATVLGLDDELFVDDAAASSLAVVGEAALLRTLARRRTGRMGDIVATIQREQDVIIRAPLEGALVVQGGPGTGKTAVALHRIAYLLHTHREFLEARGVLMVGPSPTFLRYIERVLPSLGEQRARLRTVGAVVTETPPTAVDSPEAARVKGDLRMVDVLAAAVRGRQRPLAKPAVIPFGAYRLKMAVKASDQIVARVRAKPGSHNERRAIVERLTTDYLYRYYVALVERADRAGQHPRSPVDRHEFVDTIRWSPATRALLDRLWPLLTPGQLLDDLLRHPPLLRQAAGGILAPDEQAALVRTGDGAEPRRTEADDALIDELLAHLGPLPEPARRQHAAEDLDWLADRVIEGVQADADIALSATMKAEIRERIVADRVGLDEPECPRAVTPTYGHVVVDEAQDLSPMQWRMLARQCPSGSFTVVGDVGQASGPWDLGWDTVLDIIAAERPASVVELTVNYRTPSEVMTLAGRVLAAAAPSMAVPTSVRSTGRSPDIERVEKPERAGAVSRAALDGVTRADGGTVAVIAAGDRHDQLRVALDGHERTQGGGRDPLDDPVALLSPTAAKGLEFDAVVVVEPAEIAGDTRAGLLALYVALTRTTEHLFVVHSDPLPAPLVIAGHERAYA